MSARYEAADLRTATSAGEIGGCDSAAETRDGGFVAARDVTKAGRGGGGGGCDFAAAAVARAAAGGV